MWKRSARNPVDWFIKKFYWIFVVNSNLYEHINWQCHTLMFEMLTYFELSLNDEVSKPLLCSIYVCFKFEILTFLVALLMLDMIKGYNYPEIILHKSYIIFLYAYLGLLNVILVWIWSYGQEIKQTKSRIRSSDIDTLSTNILKVLISL